MPRCVVEEVPDNALERPAIASDDAVRSRYDGGRKPVGSDCLEEGHDGDVREVGTDRQRFEPGDLEQILHEAAQPVDVLGEQLTNAAHGSG